ncbi:unnamed protein product [Brassica oleracea]|uniref:(rape) hypothetical protein n=1 Tax=Brassica napus TaxID=3708 RepID=A0A816U3S6_BRANA|nr:unnamed protein product [Brassica napus]
MFLGDASTLLTVLNRRLPELGLVRYVCTETSWIQSVLFWTNIRVGTSEIVLLQSNITVNYIKRKSDYVHEPISRTGLESIWRKMIELEIPAMAFNPYEGMMAKISPTATPFPYRADNLWKIQSYVEDTRHGEKYFDGNFERLVEIKTRVGSGNFFRNEHSFPVKPYFNI